MQDVNGLDILERMLTDPSSGMELPAAAIMKPSQGESGVNVARSQWLKHLRAICDRHGIILVIDGIQTGCGRTADFFSFEESEVVPDVVCLSKSIGGMGMPLALVLIRGNLDVWKPGQHNGAFRGNNLAFVAGRTTIDTYWSKKALSG